MIEITEAKLRPSSEIAAAVELWFFRDLGETQRRQLINWCGFPGVEANGEELQHAMLKKIIAALQAREGVAEECDKCQDSGYIETVSGGIWTGENVSTRRELCDCHCGDDARDQENGTGLHVREDVEKIGEPVDMLLWCPRCHTQHIDEPDERTPEWSNPPHRSHLCHACGCIWRPADVPTNGVASIHTVGKADNWITTPAEPGDALRECPRSPDGKHQVDTSMESGPNNCFHCEQPMRAIRKLGEG